jgi:flavin-dependent dehydrogenase
MGLVGTMPASNHVFLVGDAAGLVNPLQGEGIAQAMDSGRAAAVAVLGGMEQAPDRYRAHLARTQAPYLSTTAPIQRRLLRSPKLVAALTRGLTAPGIGRTIAGGWSIAWNNLLDGASPSIASGLAATAAGLGHILTARSADRNWITQQLVVGGEPRDSRRFTPF